MVDESYLSQPGKRKQLLRYVAVHRLEHLPLPSR